jgi:hypothetical protein
MKTLIFTETKESKYIWEDSALIVLTETQTNAPNLFIMDLNSTNAVLIGNVTPPEDWRGCKYLYDGAWTLNPKWVDPSAVNE